jgi:hypothetical protein
MVGIWSVLIVERSHELPIQAYGGSVNENKYERIFNIAYKPWPWYARFLLPFCESFYGFDDGAFFEAKKLFGRIYVVRAGGKN